MPARKRKHSEIAVAEPPAPAVSDTLQQIRNMWEFAGINQYLFTFGKAVKIPEIDIEDFEQELMKPTPSERLADIGLQLLKKVSSQRGLNHDMFADYTRRQYLAKAPLRNPFGDEEMPTPFNDLGVYTKIKVLYQLSTWTLHNPNDIRAALAEEDDTTWRIEPLGWDKEDRQYFVFDDDRLYRRTEPTIPEPVKAKPKAKPKKSRNTRSKRRRVSRTVPDTSPDDEEEDLDATEIDGEDDPAEPADDGTDGGYLWELIAITLEDYNGFLDTMKKSRDPNEKAMCKRIQDNIIPHLLTRAEERQRDAQRRAKELEVLQKLATAKRSSRLAGKQEKEAQAREEAEAERKRRADLAMAHKEQERQAKMLEDRQSRMMTREQRIKEREVKRILHEEQLAKEQEALERLEASGDAEDSDGRPRISERQLKADVKKRQEELAALEEEYDDWVFDCAVCGVHGANVDDGTHSIACEECDVWQHSACHGITQEQAESESFHFTCQDCKDKLANPPPKLKFNFGEPAAFASKVEETSVSDAQDETINGTALKTSSTQLPPKAEFHVTPRKSTTPATANVPLLSHQDRPVNQHSPTIPVLPRPKSPQAPVTFTAPPLANGFAASLQQLPGVSIPAPSQNGAHIPMPLPPPATPSTSFTSSIPTKRDPVAPSDPFRASSPVGEPAIMSSPMKQSTTSRNPSFTNGASLAMSPPALTPHQSIAPRPVHQTPISSSHPPAPVFSTPATNNHQSAFANSAALLGSSPGYSPAKQSPPPSHDAVFPPPSGNMMNGHTFSPATSFNGSQSVRSDRGMGMVPPVTLSPENKPAILTPPVKRASPPRFDLGASRES